MSSKYRICGIYDCSRGRNDGTGIYFTVNVKNRPDVDYLHLAPLSGDRNIQQYGKFDLYVWFDHGEDAFPDYTNDPIVCPKPSVYWVSDLHWSDQSRDYRINKAKEFDLVACHHQEHVQVMKDALGHDRVFWLPFAVEPKAYPRVHAVKKYDWGFVGHLNTERRINLLDTMYKEIPNGWIVWKKFFEDAAAVYHDSKISIHYSVAGDQSMRNFEVMGSGGFLLTDRNKGMETLFQDGVHCVMYDSIPDAIEKAKYYIAHDEERDKIAEAGYQEVIAKHTYKHRVDTLIEKAKEYGLIKELVTA